MAYGSINADSIVTSVSGGVLGGGNASIMKNRIINGAMVVNQRGFSGSPTDGQYTLDRFWCGLTQASKFTVSQNAGSVTPPVGFSNYLGVTSSSAYSVGASDYFYVTQSIEGFNTADLNWGTVNAKTVTLSFWVYSSLTGTFGGSINNGGSYNRTYPFSYTVSSANTWQQVSVTIAGDTTGTWTGATNAASLLINFGLGVGSTFSGTAGAWGAGNLKSATGATSIVGTNGATFYITGVQLEVGTSATGFEYRQYGQELALCQRYYYKTYSQGVTPAAATASGTRGGVAYNGGNGIAGNFSYAVSMRATPTITPYGESGSSGVWSQSGGTNTGSASASLIADQGFMQINISSLTPGNVYYGHYVASAEL